MSDARDLPRSPAEAARHSLRRVLWAIQKLAHSSLPEITEEPAEVFGRNLDTWDRLCKNAAEAETALSQKKEEQALSWLERSARGFDALARPAAAPELAELATAVEAAAKVWEKMAREAAREAGTAVWLERGWGLALEVLSAGVGALPADDRKRILEERLSELRARRKTSNSLVAAAAAAEERAREAEAGSVSRDREIAALREALEKAGARAEILDGTVLDLRRQLQESLFQHERFAQQAEADQAHARSLQSEGETLRQKLEQAQARSAADLNLARKSEGRLQALQAEVKALQELLKQADEQSASIVGRALAAETAAAALSRELASLKETASPVPAAETARLKELEAELAAARAQCAELGRSLEVAQAQLKALGAQAGESGRLRIELERGQARLAKLTAEYEAAVGPRLQ